MLLLAPLIGVLFFGGIGPIELAVWLLLVTAWVVALVKWARPRDRASQPVKG